MFGRSITFISRKICGQGFLARYQGGLSWGV
jgi:hypothetical protein